MKNWFLACLVFFATILPAAAGDFDPKVVYSPGQTVSNVVEVIPAANVPPGWKAIEFAPFVVGGDRVALHYTLQVDDTLEYTPPPPPGPQANPALFKSAVFADATIPLPTRVSLVSLGPTVDQYANTQLGVLQQIWAGLKAVQDVPGGALYGNCSDGVPITTKIEGYAAAANMPLAP